MPAPKHPTHKPVRDRGEFTTMLQRMQVGGTLRLTPRTSVNSLKVQVHHTALRLGYTISVRQVNGLVFATRLK